MDRSGIQAGEQYAIMFCCLLSTNFDNDWTKVITIVKELTRAKTGLVQPTRQKRSDTGFLRNNKTRCYVVANCGTYNDISRVLYLPSYSTSKRGYNTISHVKLNSVI